MDSVGDRLIENVREAMKENPGMEIRATFDNFDFRMLANIILKNHRNSDFHWIVQYLTFDRVSSTGLDDEKPIVDNMDDFHNSNYLLDQGEVELMKQDFIVLVSRVLVEFFPFLEPLKSIIPQHIDHQHSNEMAQKSNIISLPIVPYNQSKHADVVQYLESLTNLLTEIYASDEEYPLKENVTASERLERTEKILKGNQTEMFNYYC